MRVALFTTCLVDVLFPDAGRTTVPLLERLRQAVEFPLEQTCCGQMHANSGYFEIDLVRRENLDLSAAMLADKAQVQRTSISVMLTIPTPSC